VYLFRTREALMATPT